MAGWGLLIGGCVFLFVGGTALKGGSLSELPKTAFFNTFLIRNRSFGGWINYLRFAWQACTWGHPITFVFCVAGVALLALLKNRVAGVALGGIHHRFAWQAWRLGTSNYLRFAWQACTWGHPITFVFCVAGVALLALLKNPCFMCARDFRPQPFWFISQRRGQGYSASSTSIISQIEIHFLTFFPSAPRICAGAEGISLND